MKKILSLTPLLLVSICAGEIKDTFQKINLETDQNTRIEKKLDLIIAQYIKDEEMAELRKEVLDATIDKTKEGIHKGATWIKEKADKMLEEQ